jgi:acetyltransferase EpsM
MQSCIIYGTGGHARTLEELAIKGGYTIAAFFDDGIPKVAAGGRIPVSRYSAEFNRDCPVVIAIGNNAVRKKIAAAVSHRYCTLADSSAIISQDVVIGEGTVVLPGAIIQAGARIGAHCIVNIGSAVDHEVIVGDFVHVGPKCYIGGGAVIGDGVSIGAGTVVMRNVHIPSWTEIPPQSTIV